MKFKTIAVGMGLTALIYDAANAADFEDNAQVISSTPIVQLVSQPVCQAQTQVSSLPPSQGIMGDIIGGLTGGLLGAQVGRRNGKTVATIAGAAAGAVIGNQITTAASMSDTQTVAICGNVLRDVVVGYSVVYRYSGRDVTTSLPYEPGSVVKVGIGVIDERGAPDPERNGVTAIPPPPRGYPPPPGY